MTGSALSEHLVGARRRRPYGPPAIQERNGVALLDAKKINIIFFGLAAAVAKRKDFCHYGTYTFFNIAKFFKHFVLI